MITNSMNCDFIDDLSLFLLTFLCIVVVALVLNVNEFSKVFLNSCLVDIYIVYFFFNGQANFVPNMSISALK